MTGSPWLCAGVMLATLWPTPAGADVRDFVGRPIGAVTLEVDGRRVADSTLRAMVETQEARTLEMADVRASLLHLAALGKYDDIRVEAETVRERVLVHYRLRARRRIARVAFERAEGVDAAALSRALDEQFGKGPQVQVESEMVAFVAALLRRTGYRTASATSRREPLSTQGDELMTVTLVPGPRTRIGQITVDGDADDVATVLRRLGLREGDPYDRDALDARVQRWLDGQRRAGVLIGRLEIRELGGDAERQDLRVSVQRGRAVRISFEGDPIPAAVQADLVPIERDGVADEDVVEDSALRVQDYLRAGGYRDATVSFERRESPTQVDIAFAVTRGRLHRTDSVELADMAESLLSKVRPRLRLRAGEAFAGVQVDADVAAIEDAFRREGYSQASVVPTLTTRVDVARDAVLVGVVIRATPGPQTLVNEVRIDGVSSEGDLRDRLALRAGQPLYPPQLAADRDAVQLWYANHGYPAASVSSTVETSADGTRADVILRVTPGQRVIVEHVLIVGNTRTRTAVITRELRVRPGDPLSLESLTESQRALATLGVFRRVRISELAHGDPGRRDVLVSVEEAPATTVGYGGGLEVWQQLQQVSGVASERVEYAPRAFFEVGRRNLFGKNRSLNLFTRASLLPQDTADGRTFSEYRVIGTFREPRAAGSSADAFLTATVEQQRRSSFNFARQAFVAEAGRRVSTRVSVSAGYQLQRTELFDEAIDPADKLLIDRVFPQVRLSSFAASTARDTRDDLTDPSRGLFLSANGQVAARHIGSEVGFGRVYLTGQGFTRMSSARASVLAVSARVGLATAFAREIAATEIGADGTSIINGTIVVRDLPASERFFAGGDTTVRGFALDQVGQPDTLDKDGFPIGGAGLLLLNAEVRVPVRGGLGGVVFVDAGNVFAKASDISPMALRVATGIGLRYKSPIGPIRFDLGFKARRHEVAGRRETPYAIHISLGQAF